jgi:predicted nucleotidyltransferase
MADPVIPPSLKAPVARLVRALAPTRIVLFGSYAKAEAQAGSDIDLLVITDAAARPEAATRRARQLVAPSFPPIDVVLCTPEDAENAAGLRSPFLQSILESGITLYTRRYERPPLRSNQGPAANM